LVFPVNLFLIIPSVVILIVTFLASSAYFRKNTVRQAETVSLRKRVLLRVFAVIVGCVFLAIPPMCVAAAYPRLDAEYTKNVLVYYRAKQGGPVNTRTNVGHQLYQLEGLSPEEFLFSNNQWSLWDGTLPRIIMHPDVQEPLFTFPLRSLQFNDIERGNVVITDADTLSAFRAFVLNESNGTMAERYRSYSVYTEMQGDKSVQLYFDVPCEMYWFADYEMRDGRIIVYGRLHNAEMDYAYDVTHILGEYF